MHVKLKSLFSETQSRRAVIFCFVLLFFGCEKQTALSHAVVENEVSKSNLDGSWVQIKIRPDSGYEMNLESPSELYLSESHSIQPIKKEKTEFFYEIPKSEIESHTLRSLHYVCDHEKTKCIKQELDVKLK